MNDASLRQRQAANPRASTWLSANAGSGKTRVLTDRVARLLLDGVNPQHVLCLTYTKAAASEMQNRLFARLGEWAMLDDPALRRALADLGVEGPLDLDRARTLFARAIETPGGLRLQTIHAFCASILRRFPLEAGVSPAFVEIDETAQGSLFARLLDEIAIGPDAIAIDGLADHTGIDVAQIAFAVAARREAFAAPLDLAAARAFFGAAARETAESLVSFVFDDGAADLLAKVRDACHNGGKNDVTACEVISAIHLTNPVIEDVSALEGPFLYGAGTKSPFGPKTGAFPTKRVRAALDQGDLDALDALMQRVAEARPRRLALAAAERTAALHAFAGVFLPRYEAAKAAAGWVDYDDLILKVRRLLEDRAVADWVLYRLDGGIDHILVDEAQDTSPGQWQVIERLAAEFAAGRGAREDVTRTLFVVGDIKQSIYSFQGADPEAFARMADAFASRLATGVTRLELLHSFRSSRAILETVDRVAGGLPGLGDVVRHRPFHETLPGRVDLWQIVPKPDKPEERRWSEPVDMPADNAAHVVLARRLARWLKARIDERTAIPDKNGVLRPLNPGDALILVQRRNEMFHEIIRALKVEGLPVAGADRLVLTKELAVRDLLALASFLALPEDDLSLATALRSPLFGWTEAELFDLAHERDGYLWAALRERTDHEATTAVLHDLRNQADYARPYDLLERILVRHDGRGRLIARLGAEVEDGIDELLNKALDYERTEVPSLTGFLSWIAAEDVEVKRQPDAAGERVRVMTVHGAKGLEAPMVILPDTLREEPRLREEIVLADGVPCWKMRKEDEPPPLSDARREQERVEREERSRLLYVAMTRARSWLVVCGAGEQRGQAGNWHTTIGAALQDHAVPCDFDGSEGLRLERGDWMAPLQDADATEAPPAAVVVDEVAPPPPQRTEPLRASSLGGAKALPGEGLDEATAKARGTALHLLLEHLPACPASERAALAGRLLGVHDPGLLAEAASVLDATDLVPLFGPGALAEVDVSATLPQLGGLPLRGTIDRLMVEPERVLCVDFKSNRTIPTAPETVPDGILRQMGAYAAALSQLYPDRRIETAILWTRTATLMSLPAALTTAALLDARQGRP